MKEIFSKWFVVFVVLVVVGAIGLSGCKGATTEETVAEETTEETAAEEPVEEKTEEAEAEVSVVNKEGKVISIAHVNFTQFPCYQCREKGNKMAAEDYGVQFTTIVPKEITIDSYIEALETTIAQDFDALIVEPWITDPFYAPLQKVKDKGIPVVGVHVPFPDPELLLSQIIVSTGELGKTQAKILYEKSGGKANILIMMTNPDVANQAQIKQAFEEAISELSPDMKVVDTEFTEADATKGAERLEAAFKAYPEIDTVLFLESGSVVVAADIAKEMGILDKLTILGIDDPPDLIDAIRRGDVWGSCNQNFYKQGYESVRNICDYYLGNPFPKETDAGVVLITKENVDDYLDDMLEPIAMKGEPYPNL